MIGWAVNFATTVAVVITLAGVHRAGAGDQYPIERTVRYRVTVRNVTAESVQKAEAGVYAPVRQTAT